MKQSLKLFDCCEVTVGFSKSIIIDTQRERIYEIPKDLGVLLLKYETYNIDIISAKEKIEKKVLIAIFDKLLDQDLVFYENNRFLDFGINEKINSYNLILEIGSYLQIPHNSEKIVRALSQINFRDMEVRCYHSVYFDLLITFLHKAPLHKILSKTLINCSNYEELISLVNKMEQVHSEVEVVFFLPAELENDLPENHSSELNNIENSKIIYGQKLSRKLCGNIGFDSFYCSKNFVLTSEKANSCLGNKISIDDKGEVKVCPSFSWSFGNISDLELDQLIKFPDSKMLDYWTLTKDKINICKDCVYRRICFDCRAYLENPSDIYSKPLKCGYNPYTGEWINWETDTMKKDAMTYYQLTDLYGL